MTINRMRRVGRRATTWVAGCVVACALVSTPALAHASALTAASDSESRDAIATVALRTGAPVYETASVSPRGIGADHERVPATDTDAEPRELAATGAEWQGRFALIAATGLALLLGIATLIARLDLRSRRDSRG